MHNGSARARMMEVRRMAKRLLAMVGLALLVLSVACSGAQTGASSSGGASGGSGGAAKEITITMSEFKFDPAEIRVKQGERVVLTLQNTGAAVHDLSIKDFNVTSPKVQPGQSGKVEFTANKTGTFDFICAEPGHEAAGMKGKLIVE